MWDASHTDSYKRSAAWNRERCILWLQRCTIAVTMAAMKCLFCKEALPEPVQPRKHYCNSTCRANACRERKQKSPRRHLKRGEARAQERNHSQHKRLRMVATQHRTIRANISAVRPFPQNGFLCSSSFYASSGARLHRLVLPPFVGERMPRFSPPIDEKGQIRSYSLSPFEQPDDIHLFDGQMYRVLWIGASGQLSHRNRMALCQDSASG